MLDEGRNCEDVVIPLAAAGKALDRAGWGLDAGGLRECLNMGDDAHIDTAKLERLFVARLILSLLIRSLAGRSSSGKVAIISGLGVAAFTES